MRHLLHIIILSLLMIMGGNSCMASCDGMALIADGITTDAEKKSNSDRLVDLSDPEPPLAVPSHLSVTSPPSCFGM